MRFFIRNSETGRFATKPGSEKNYTKSIRKAKNYLFYTNALSDCCGNEEVISLDDIIQLPED